MELQAPAQPTTAWVIEGRYRIDEQIGRGGSSQVYRAHDELLGRDVAIKMFHAGLPDEGESEEQRQARRELEMRTVANLNHPGLVRLLDASPVGANPPYLVFELVCGQNLAQRLQGGALPEPEVREFGAQLAETLAFLHRNGLVHRDVKPGNILLDSSDPDAPYARLCDFGIVRLIDSANLTSSHLTVGTAAYLAPEQLYGSDVGPAADVYALGLVLLESLTGSKAFVGTQAETLAQRASSAPQIPNFLDGQWRSLLAAMTASDPRDRPDPLSVTSTLRGQAVQQAGLLADSPTIAATADLAPADSGPAHTKVLPVRQSARLRRIPARATFLLAVAAVIAVLGLGAVGAMLSAPHRKPPAPAPTHAAVVVPTHATPSTSAPVAPAAATNVNSQHPAKPGHGQHGHHGAVSPAPLSANPAAATTPAAATSGAPSAASTGSQSATSTSSTTVAAATTPAPTPTASPTPTTAAA